MYIVGVCKDGLNLTIDANFTIASYICCRRSTHKENMII